MRTNFDKKTAELRLKGNLLEIKNLVYVEIDIVIWNHRKKYSSWLKQYEAIKNIMKQMDKDMLAAMKESNLVLTEEE